MFLSFCIKLPDPPGISDTATLPFWPFWPLCLLYPCVIPSESVSLLRTRSSTESLFCHLNDPSLYNGLTSWHALNPPTAIPPKGQVYWKMCANYQVKVESTQIAQFLYYLLNRGWKRNGGFSWVEVLWWRWRWWQGSPSYWAGRWFFHQQPRICASPWSCLQGAAKWTVLGGQMWSFEHIVF